MRSPALSKMIEKKSNLGFYGLIPFVSCFIALVILKDVKGISLKNVNLVLFVSFFAHFGAMRAYPDQPVFQFSIPLFLAQSQQSVDRMHIPNSMKLAYEEMVVKLPEWCKKMEWIFLR